MIIPTANGICFALEWFSTKRFPLIRHRQRVGGDTFPTKGKAFRTSDTRVERRTLPLSDARAAADEQCSSLQPTNNYQLTTNNYPLTTAFCAAVHTVRAKPIAFCSAVLYNGTIFREGGTSVPYAVKTIDRVIRGSCPLYVCSYCRTKCGWKHQSWCEKLLLVEPGCEDCRYYKALSRRCAHPAGKKDRRDLRHEED